MTATEVNVIKPGKEKNKTKNNEKTKTIPIKYKI